MPQLVDEVEADTWITPLLKEVDEVASFKKLYSAPYDRRKQGPDSAKAFQKRGCRYLGRIGLATWPVP